MTQKLYCGLDIYKDKYMACLLDEEGNELRNIINSIGLSETEIRKIIKKII